MPGRVLTSRARQVSDARRAEYDAAWDAVRSAATARGAHAWRFASTILPDRYLEFLEFAEGADPRGDAGVKAAARALDERFPAPEAEEWAEIR